jgi:hypothetical protein
MSIKNSIIVIMIFGTTSNFFSQSAHASCSAPIKKPGVSVLFPKHASISTHPALLLNFENYSRSEIETVILASASESVAMQLNWTDHARALATPVTLLKKDDGYHLAISVKGKPNVLTAGVGAFKVTKTKGKPPVWLGKPTIVEAVMHAPNEPRPRKTKVQISIPSKRAQWASVKFTSGEHQSSALASIWKDSITFVNDQCNSSSARFYLGKMQAELTLIDDSGQKSASKKVSFVIKETQDRP